MVEQMESNYRPPNYLSEPFKAANRLTVSRSIFKTLPQPFLIPHSDIVTGIHVPSICERKIWVREKLILQRLINS